MPNKQRKIRIIAGHWRGRKLSVPDLPGLRPTADRVRETLFNWLAPYVTGARCLDLFAGSGALGLEAASRGAKSVVLVENQRQAAERLRAHVSLLHATQVQVVQKDARRFLAGPAQPFDLVFLDPPFADNLLEVVCPLLANRGWLAPQARVYLEMPRALAEQAGLALPAGWTISRRHLTRESGCWLVESSSGSESAGLKD